MYTAFTAQLLYQCRPYTRCLLPKSAANAQSQAWVCVLSSPYKHIRSLLNGQKPKQRQTPSTPKQELHSQERPQVADKFCFQFKCYKRNTDSNRTLYMLHPYPSLSKSTAHTCSTTNCKVQYQIFYFWVTTMFSVLRVLLKWKSWAVNG